MRKKLQLKIPNTKTQKRSITRKKKIANLNLKTRRLSMEKKAANLLRKSVVKYLNLKVVLTVQS